MIGIISKNNKISNVEPGVTLNIYDPIGVFYNEIAHYFIMDIKHLKNLVAEYKLKDIICAFTSKEVKNEFKNVIFYENKNMTIDEALEYFYKANDIQRRKKENELRSFARYQVFVTEEEKRLRNEFSCMDYLDDDDIGGS